MSLRPGTQYIANTYDDLASRSIAFVFANNDTARIELTPSGMRVFIDDAVITRSGVGTTTTNDGFVSNLNGWTDNDESGATSQWTNGHIGGNFSFTGGYMGLTGNGTNAAIRDQEVTVAALWQNNEHALRITIANGPVMLRVGSTIGDDDYITETALDTGSHSLAFTPTGNFHIRFFSSLKRQVLVDRCVVELTGVMLVPTPWTTDAQIAALGVSNDLQYSQQSGDVIFIACPGLQQYKIERRATRSWSVAKYVTDDGPFRKPNIGPISLAAALSGNILINSTKAFFKPTHVGALFRITSDGQRRAATISAENQFTGTIVVEDITNARLFTVFIDEDAGGSATFTLQRSLDSDAGPWTDVMQWTADTTEIFDDGLDNQIVYYRLGVKTGDYGSGTHTVSLQYSGGSITGVARVTAFVTDTSVDAEVIVDFGSTDASDDWAEGQWSDYRGWPTFGAFYEGRLYWGGRLINGSISDGFYNFDDTVEGDSGPIVRSIGSGPVDNVNWILPLQRLLLGTDSAEHSVRASSIDEILTPNNFNIRSPSNHGSAQVAGLKIDSNGLYVSKGGTRVYELNISDAVDYNSVDVTAIVPEVCEPRIVRAAVQRLPDTRAHFVLADGTAAVLVYDKVEEVLCWLKVEVNDGAALIEDVCVLPAPSGSTEDQVYYSVAVTISGATKRLTLKWALESECRPSGGVLQVNKQADAFVAYNQAASSTIGGLSHLIGKSVVVWDNGKCLTDANGDIATFTVNGSGEITVTNGGAAYEATVGMAGLPFTGQWRSARLPELMQFGSLADEQRIEAIQLILADVHAKGLRFGPALDTSVMDDLPRLDEEYALVAPDAIRDSYVTGEIAFPGKFSTDARLCLIAQAPRPCTVLAAIARVEHH